eukprot:207252_1
MLLMYMYDQQSAVQAKSSAVAKLSDPAKHISVSAKRKVPPPTGQKASTDANGTMRRTTAVEQSSAGGVEPSRDGAMKSTDHVEQRERAIRVKQSRAHGSAQSVEATKVTVVAPAKADLATQAKADLTTQANGVLTTHAKAGLTTHAT